MATSPPPAKRLRRSTTILSDDDYEERQNGDSPSRVVSETNTTKASPNKGRSSSTQSNKIAWPSERSTTSSPKSSPEKARKGKRSKIEETKNKSLHNFFGKATEDERWRKRSQTPEIDTKAIPPEDDIIDDDILDEGFSVTRNLDVQHEPSNGTQGSSVPNPGSSVRTRSPASSGQRFVKPAVPKRSSLGREISLDTSNGEEFHRTWADRYGPVHIEELAVHRKKVADVGKWLDDALTGRSKQRLLVLKGPAGTGKTATVQLLAEARNLNIVMWQNPTVSESGYLSASVQFGEFLNRGGQYGALSFADDEAASSTSDIGRRVLLVEDFPSSMTRSSSALDSFRSVLLRYVADGGQNNLMQSKDALVSHPPVVVIVSETLVSSATAVFDSFTAHRLLGPELSNHPSVTVIEVNPVAPTFMIKALELVTKKEARDSRRRRIPGPAVMQKLAEVGDIRSAVNSLEFLCARGDENMDWSGTVAANAKRGSRGSMKLTEMEENSLRLVSQRETTLDMFHAVGKVVYNKRDDPRVHDSRAELPPKPPDHLMHVYSPKVSQVDIEALLNETGTDIQTFISTLYENYVLSCNGDDFVDHFAGSSHALSDSDILNPDSRQVGRARMSTRSFQYGVQLGTSDSLRQDEISFQAAVRGLLFSLPYPVTRATPSSGRKSDSFKMFYPASLRLWKPTEEIHDLIQFYADQLTNSSEQQNLGGSGSDGVASWKNRIGAFGLRTASAHDHEEGAMVPRIDASKDNLVLEIFPFMAKIWACRDKDVSVLNKITLLRGVNVSGDEPYDEDEAEGLNNASERLTQKVEAVHSSLAQQARKSMALRQFGKESVKLGKEQSTQTEPSIDSLVIEDDDIEDD